MQNNIRSRKTFWWEFVTENKFWRATTHDMCKICRSSILLFFFTITKTMLIRKMNFFCCFVHASSNNRFVNELLRTKSFELIYSDDAIVQTNSSIYDSWVSVLYTIFTLSEEWKKLITVLNLFNYLSIAVDGFSFFRIINERAIF